ncbi:hypothetical protein [Saccharibacillus sacchari]|uniref:Uncharacterized protein n=1 Tax=Saccharibacillus sacchari TaxID=456493 RepID=A0ACC6P9N8_9BACL
MIHKDLGNPSSFDMDTVLSSLAHKRPLFHNEADFQHALAWEIREMYDCKIRLEKRIDIQAGKRTYLDIWIEHEGQTYGIELKYKIRGAEYVHEEETFSFLNQSAHDIGRYDIVKDVQRLEQMVRLGRIHKGMLILVTNDAAYYRHPGVEKFTADRDFRIHEGRMLTGQMRWSDLTGAGTMKGRTEPISLQGSYPMRWQDYSTFETAAFAMRRLLVSITSNGLSADVDVAPPATAPEVVAPEPVIAAALPGATERARIYIREQLRTAKSNGDAYCDLISGDIHRVLNFKNSMPIVCQAMISIPEYRFRILSDSPSGKTSTKKIRYFLNVTPDS